MASALKGDNAREGRGCHRWYSYQLWLQRGKRASGREVQSQFQSREASTSGMVQHGVAG